MYSYCLTDPHKSFFGRDVGLGGRGREKRRDDDETSVFCFCLPLSFLRARPPSLPPFSHTPLTPHARPQTPALNQKNSPLPKTQKADAISAELETIGPLFERNAVFPAKTNTEFVEVLTPKHVRMVVWERGAGRTLACGTGACATVVAGVLEGRVERTCRVDLPGGPLIIEWRESDNRIYMTGPAELVFAGSAGA